MDGDPQVDIRPPVGGTRGDAATHPGGHDAVVGREDFGCLIDQALLRAG
jgi:hypothetical protein